MQLLLFNAKYTTLDHYVKILILDIFWEELSSSYLAQRLENSVGITDDLSLLLRCFSSALHRIGKKVYYFCKLEFLFN